MFGLEDNTQLTELEAMTIKETIKISQIFGQADACTLVADTQTLEGQWYLINLYCILYILKASDFYCRFTLSLVDVAATSPPLRHL